MILHIDHLSIVFSNFEKGIRLMSSLGYKVRFREMGIKNLEIKRPLLSKFSKYHDLALLDRQDSISVEVVSYGHIASNFSNFVPLVEYSDCYYVVDSFQRFIDNFDFNAREVSLSRFFLRVKDLEYSIFFWNLFGFKIFKKEASNAILKFELLFSKITCYLHLQEDLQFDKSFFLDDNGFNSIAFVSSSVKKERDNLVKQGIKVTEISSLVINNKILEIFFVKGESGELVEIIGIGCSVK